MSHHDGCTCEHCACERHAGFFSALGNTNRLSVVLALRRGPKNVTALAEEIGIEQSALSHALKQLESHGIVRSHKDGQYRIYALDEARVEPLWSILDLEAANA